MRQVPLIKYTFVRIFLFIPLFYLILSIDAPVFSLPPPHATLTHVGKIDVLNLHGSYLQMGQQYGRLERVKLQGFYLRLYALLIIHGHLPYNVLYQTIALRLYQEYPMRFQQIIRGMSETSGLSLKQEIFLNAFEYTLWKLKRSNISLPGCSFISASSAYTKGGGLILGRNYDYFRGLNPIRALLSMVVFHPNSGDNTVALISYLGTLNATTLLNNKGLFLELNSAYPSGLLLKDHGVTHWDRMYTPIDLFAMMLDAPNMHNLKLQLHSYRSNNDFIINVANKQAAYSYEWSLNNIKQAQSSKTSGLIVSTNHFVDPAWHISKTTNLFRTKERRQHLLAKAKKHKGGLTIPLMQKILNIPINQGGALAPDTVFQVIARPRDNTVWLKIPEVQSTWAKINLKTYFNT